VSNSTRSSDRQPAAVLPNRHIQILLPHAWELGLDGERGALVRELHRGPVEPGQPPEARDRGLAGKRSKVRWRAVQRLLEHAEERAELVEERECGHVVVVGFEVGRSYELRDRRPRRLSGLYIHARPQAGPADGVWSSFGKSFEGAGKGKQRREAAGRF
jgi:hypothetical protein